MKIIKPGLLWVSTLIGTVFISSLYGIGAKGEAVSMHAEKNGKSIRIDLSVKKGYGIQKKGPHELVIYELPDNFAASNNSAKAFEARGKRIYEQKSVKFQGKAAKEDQDYFSSVDTINIPVRLDGKKGISARLFFCSFKDNFCSVETLTTILE